MTDISTIQGGVARDQRGQIRFVNAFDMTLVKRFYIIKNTDIDLVRGWRAHRIEQRWFYVLSGSFLLDLVQIDDWANPSQELPVERRELSASLMELLHVPKGYATAFRALQPHSELLVFADYPFEHAVHDDYAWDEDYFANRLVI